MNKPLLISTVLLLTVFFAVSFAAGIDSFTFLRASADARAVVKGPEGEAQVIKPGDELAPGVTVTEISAGRVVLEESTERGPVTVIVSITPEGQKLRRISRTPPRRQPLMGVPPVKIQDTN